MNIKILITGAGGFIGKHLCQYLQNAGFFVIAYANHLPNEEFIQLIEQEKPQYILHCAGGASVSESFNNPEKDFENSVTVTRFVLNTLREYSPLTKFVFFSSAAVYGNPEKLPINTTTPIQPISPYGYHKFLCELICNEFHHLYQIPVTILRIFSVYGPGLKRQILWDLYKKAISTQEISLFGTGKETRDFMYIDDLTNVVSNLLAKSSFDANIINVGTGRSITIQQLAETLLKAMNSVRTIRFTGKTKLGDPSFWELDEASLTLMPAKRVLFEVGIQNYLDWIIKEAV